MGGGGGGGESREVVRGGEGGEGKERRRDSEKEGRKGSVNGSVNNSSEPARGLLVIDSDAAGELRLGGRGRNEPCTPPTAMILEPPNNNTDHVPPTALTTLAPAQAQGRS